MDPVIFEIKNYMIIWRQLEMREFDSQSVSVRAIVRCTGTEPKTSAAYTMDVLFVAPDSPYPQPQVVSAESKGYMFLPVADLDAFVNTLRYEKPIYGHLRPDKPEWTSITTSQEPVGEQESGPA